MSAQGVPPPGARAARPWYREAFGAGYLRLYAHRDEADAARAATFLAEKAGLGHSDRLLDLCCGPGRHLSLLCSGVRRAVGLDLSRALLAQARRVARGSPFDLVEADMRRLPFTAEAFSLVINLFTSFGYFTEEAQNRAVLEEIARVLAPGGRLAIDHINSASLTASLEPRRERTLAGGVRVIEERALDRAARRINKHVTWIEASGQEIRWNESVRVYERNELAEMLAGAGLRPIGEPFGDFDGSALTASSPRMIFVARRADAA